MIRGTTPTITFTILSDTVDLTAADKVFVSLTQGTTVIEKTGDYLSVGENTVSVWLTQAESMKLTEDIPAYVQINWTYEDAVTGETRRAATKDKEIPITKQLLRRVIT